MPRTLRQQPHNDEDFSGLRSVLLAIGESIEMSMVMLLDQLEVILTENIEQFVNDESKFKNTQIEFLDAEKVLDSLHVDCN